MARETVEDPPPETAETGEGAADGRRLRSQRSRERILAALEQVLAQPDLDLRPEAISARAGVSLSTFFRHFGDMAGVARAMRERIEARVRPHLAGGPYPAGAPRERVRELVRRLTTGFEIVAPFYRVTVRQSAWPSTARELPLEVAEATRAQVQAALGPELAGAPDRELVLCTLLSFDAWSHMRGVRGLSQERVAAVLEDAVLALLESR